MKINAKGMTRENRHARNLSLKLEHELSENVVSDCVKWSDFEHRKKIVDSIHGSMSHSRRRERMKALRFEEVAEGQSLLVT